MALNGGVSLAVWMGGAAVELDAARRAHLPDAERPIYAAICKAFKRELVLDLMTGSSAGGINGALLAGAIAWRRRLTADFLRPKWLALGSFSDLLQPLSVSDPKSLMQGAYFHAELQKAFHDLHKGRCGTSLPEKVAARLSTNVRLEVTTTDMHGAKHSFRDVWGEDLVAREYRQRFKFEDELVPDDLAMAARSSASFPVAFEPFDVPAGKLGELPGLRHVLDGGLLDNAPIRAVLDLIPSRAATRQVRRYVCYVNADPPVAGVDAASEPPPGLRDVAGAVVGIPRKAGFIDQLTAIQSATRESRLAGPSCKQLLELPIEALQDTAAGLLDPYRRRRRVLSLEEFIPQPSEVERVVGALLRLPAGTDLPWIPTSLDSPGPTDWGWGVRAAQRALHLLLDSIRPAIPGATSDDRAELLKARAKLDEQLLRLEDRHRALVVDEQIVPLMRGLPGDDDLPGTVMALGELMADYDQAIHAAVRAGAAAAYRAARHIDASSASGLFGRRPFGRELTDRRFANFLTRAFCVEVVRRAFHADEVFETAQRIHFAQLTPFAPALFMTGQPLASPVPRSTPEEKLTGIPLAHFAGFYRESWRANDFMWGRLDGAVRVVDMLVDRDRALEVADVLKGPRPWRTLAEAIVDEPRTGRASCSSSPSVCPKTTRSCGPTSPVDSRPTFATATAGSPERSAAGPFRPRSSNRSFRICAPPRLTTPSWAPTHSS